MRRRGYFQKGQITLIVIVGMIILIVFSALFALRSAFSHDQADPTTKLLYEIESGLVKNQITDCIFRVGSEGLEKLAANGGNLYDYDGGRIPISVMQEGEHYLKHNIGSRAYRVAYGLRENSFCPQVVYSTPDYPHVDINLSDFPAIYNSDENCAFAHPGADFDGMIGEVTMPKLCSIIGDSSCRNFGKGAVVGLTIQRQLEDYIARKVPLCVDLSDFSEQYNAQIEQDGNLSVRVSVRDEDVQLYVEYPFLITFKDAQPISKIVKYQSVLKVRFGRLYNYLYDVLSKDARDPFFDMKLQSLASSYWVPGFSFKKIENPCTSCEAPLNYDDLVEVLDSKSILNGKPFLFRAAIQDRRPVLSFIQNKSYDINSLLPPDQVVTNSEILLNAVDPDDTPLKFVFMGEGPVPGWRDNDDVISEFDNGTYLTIYFSANDLGEHPVSVMVIDESGFFDYQSFNMTVSDSSRTVDPHDYMVTCVNPCAEDATGVDCLDWCWITLNVCMSSDQCLGTYKGVDDYVDCYNCVASIYYSNESEPHSDCRLIYDPASCNSLQPDCFWVKEPYAEPPNTGSCYNDHDLWQVARSAMISN
ncbi:hypothetical protein JW711_06310 [Candidatus Woesearchaeota archaeon]|nr:hypothetical protein [Candidatus Woesearchaeota archaeon]